MNDVRIALRSPNRGAGHTAGDLRRFMAGVEASSLDAVYSGDHVSFHDGTGFDGLVQAAALAAMSERVTIWTAVYLLALRHPVPVARQVADIAGLAPGRFVFGVGLGGEDRHELEICGVDPRRRGHQLDLHLDVVRSLLAGDTVNRTGDLEIPDAIIRPTPSPAVPILVGGRSDAALARTARAGDGWIGIWIDPPRAAASMAMIAEHAASIGRNDPPSRNALMVWCGLGPSVESARDAVAATMAGLYKTPFERFARYTPAGRPADVAAAIAPYIEIGFTEILLNAVAPPGHDVVALADEVAQLLHPIIRFTYRRETLMDLSAIPELIHGRTWDEMPAGFTFRTSSRTLNGADVRAFINVVGINEPLFYDEREAVAAGYTQTPVPGMMTFAVSEGLVIQGGSIHGTGVAFVHTDLDIKGPVYIGDTLTVVVEVTESRPTSKPGRGLVTTRNTVFNQAGEIVMIYTPVRLTKGKDGG